MKKILTIAIPSYNVEKTLSETLASLMVDSVIENLDIIIVNDGSTDNTIKVATKYKLLDRLPSSVNGLSHINSASNNAILESGREAPYVQEIAVQRPDFC